MSLVDRSESDVLHNCYDPAAVATRGQAYKKGGSSPRGLSILFWPSPMQGAFARLLCLLFLSFDELDLFAGVTLWRAVLKGNTLTPSSELYRLHSENTARFLALEFHSHLYGSLSMGKMRVVFLLVSSQSKSFH